MRLVRTRDMNLVASIMKHPKVWPHAHDDGTPEDWMPSDIDAFHWMIVVVDGQAQGLFLVHPINTYCYEMHTCLLPQIWGPLAAEAAQMLLKWAFEELGCKKMITTVPAYNRAALRFAKAGGMTQEGVNRASMMRNGSLIDQIMLGITEQEWTSCQQQSH